VSILKDLEGRLERLVEGAFAKGFKSGVQPVEIAKRLDREMEAGRTVSVNKVYMPNEYTVILSPADMRAVSDFQDKLTEELKAYLEQRRKDKKYNVLGSITIVLKEDPALEIGRLETDSRLVTTANMDNPEAVATLTLLVGGEEEDTYFIGRGRSTIGRLESNTIAVPDTGMSRHHTEIMADESKFILTDLGSTNGTFVNGKRVAEAELKDGDTIEIGKVALRFRRL
jgi:hypothetical protein